MVEEKLKKWVKKKLEEGVEEQRIKESLKDTGHDPSIVDDVTDPFKDSDVKPENAFEGENKGSQPEDDGEVEESESNPETEEEMKQEISQESEKKQESSGMMETLSISKLPSVNIQFSWKKLLASSFGVVLILGAVFGLKMVSDGDVSPLSNGDKFTGCTNQGVMIESVSAINGETEARVRVVRNKSKVVLKIKQSGETVGKSYDTFIGRKNMTVDAVGDEAVFHPVGCKRYIWRKSY